jgi:hypothetical protein
VAALTDAIDWPYAGGVEEPPKLFPYRRGVPVQLRQASLGGGLLDFFKAGVQPSLSVSGGWRRGRASACSLSSWRNSLTPP